MLTLGLYPSSGGPSKSVPAFADALGAKVISWVDPIQLRRESLIWSDSLLVHGSSLPVLRQLLIPQAADLAAAEQIIASSDLVSCHSFWRWHCIWLQRVANRYRVPYWFVPHGILDPYVFTKNRLAKKMFLAMGGMQFLQDASGVVCATRREYEKIAHFFPKKTHAIIPWPLEEGDFRDRDEDLRCKVRARFGIPPDSLCLLYLGRLHPMKRPLQTVEAVARAKQSVHLVIVGNEFGITRSELERRAKSLGISDRVHIAGPAFRTEKQQYLDVADVYISLSYRENFNFAAAECMAAGLPAILSSGNDLAGDLADIDCGWMLREGDPPEMAIDAAAQLSPYSLQMKGRNAKLWCQQHLQKDAFIAQVRSFAASIQGAMPKRGISKCATPH